MVTDAWLPTKGYREEEQQGFGSVIFENKVD